jgi:succinoglycan biosynthesis protein ExoM
MNDTEKKVAAVCVCTSGTRNSLYACLDSLNKQTLPDSFKMLIIVIDNSANGDVSSNKNLHNAFTNNMVFCHENRPGIPFARNAAIKKASQLKASYVAFIDDDEIAPENWLSRLIQGIISNDADVIVGGVGRSDTLEGAIQSAANHTIANQLSDLPIVKTAVTSNVLFDIRLVLPPLELDFDENMYFGGSDREFFMRAVINGCKIVSAEDELVFEVWPTERREIKYLLMRWFRYGVSFNHRYCKNFHPIKGYTLVWLMFLYKILGSPIKIATLPIRILWDKRPLRRLIGLPIADAAYGLGCIAPFLGIRPNKYY